MSQDPDYGPIRFDKSPQGVMHKRGNKKLRDATVEATKLPEESVRPLEEKREFAQASNEDLESYRKYRAIQQQGAPMIAKGANRLSEARAKFLETGDPDDSALVDLAESALLRVQKHWQQLERAALGAWKDECRRNATKRERDEDLEFWLGGGEISPETKPHLPSCHVYPIADRYPQAARASAAMNSVARAEVLAMPPTDRAIPTERFAELNAQYSAALACWAAENGDRVSVPEWNGHPLPDYDQVSREDFDAWIVANARIPNAAEIRGMFRGPSKSEKKRAEVQAQINAHHNSTAQRTKAAGVNSLVARIRAQQAK